MVEQGREPFRFVLPRSFAHTIQSLGHPFSTLCWLVVRLSDVLLGQGPSLRNLRLPLPRVLFGCFVGNTPLFDSSLACLHGLCFWLPVPVRWAGWPRMPARSPGSRACSFPTCSWLLDYAGPARNSRWHSPQCGLPVRSTRSAPGLRFSKLDSRPVGASVYASPGTSRHPAQDSRSRWFATPFLWGSFIPYCTPVYPGDCAPLRSRLGNVR
jgi:hypothetical protein